MNLLKISEKQFINAQQIIKIHIDGKIPNEPSKILVTFTLRGSSAEWAAIDEAEFNRFIAYNSIFQFDLLGEGSTSTEKLQGDANGK